MLDCLPGSSEAGDLVHGKKHVQPSCGIVSGVVSQLKTNGNGGAAGGNRRFYWPSEVSKDIIKIKEVFYAENDRFREERV